MAVKQAKTKPISKRSAAKRATRKKSVGSQTDKKRSSSGVVSKAKKVVRAVIAGAASGAVQGAVEAGKDATGLGKKGPKARPPQRS